MRGLIAELKVIYCYIINTYKYLIFTYAIIFQLLILNVISNELITN